ncbi:hypothetical protein SDC9_143383 [bioreactor metagenome]|uniref:Uncharacterized protein n=1 Tax=bioreactor metagenome TaxID=1076179 RepID=A0A645E3Y2_9ZZZZ
MEQSCLPLMITTVLLPACFIMHTSLWSYIGIAFIFTIITSIYLFKGWHFEGLCHTGIQTLILIQLMQKLSGAAEVVIVLAARSTSCPSFSCADNHRIFIVKWFFILSVKRIIITVIISSRRSIIIWQIIFMLIRTTK